MDSVLWLHILLNFRTAVHIERRLIDDWRRIGKDYLRRWCPFGCLPSTHAPSFPSSRVVILFLKKRFVLDLLGVYPFQWHVGCDAMVRGLDECMVVQAPSAIAEAWPTLLRFLRFVRLAHYLRRAWRRLRDGARGARPPASRMRSERAAVCIAAALWLFAACHLAACVLFWGAALNDYNEHTWVHRVYASGRVHTSEPARWGARIVSFGACRRRTPRGHGASDGAGISGCLSDRARAPSASTVGMLRDI